MSQLYTLDRLEEDTAILLAPDETVLQVPRSDLAAEARDGMLLRFDEQRGLYCPDQAATRQRQEAMRRKMARLLHPEATQK